MADDEPRLLGCLAGAVFSRGFAIAALIVLAEVATGAQGCTRTHVSDAYRIEPSSLSEAAVFVFLGVLAQGFGAVLFWADRAANEKARIKSVGRVVGVRGTGSVNIVVELEHRVGDTVYRANEVMVVSSEEICLDDSFTIWFDPAIPQQVYVTEPRPALNRMIAWGLLLVLGGVGAWLIVSASWGAFAKLVAAH